MKLTRKDFRHNRKGFSLVEVAMAIGILGFVMVTLIGLLPAGLSSFKQAMGNTIESQIVQNVSNDLLLSNFSVLATYAQSPTPQTYYYDNEGTQLPSSTGYVYKASIALTAIDNPNSPITYYNNTTTVPPAYNVTITLTSATDQSVYTQQHAHIYSIIVANNGL